MRDKNRLNFDYNTSKDYNKLYDLIQTQRIVCIVTYSDKLLNDKTIELRDICSSGVFFDNENINIGCRGTGFVTAFPFDGNSAKEEFLKQCKHYKLEFIDPEMVNQIEE